MKKPFYPPDFKSEVWAKFEDHLQDLLAKARTRLEGQALDESPTRTIRVRERIAVLKQLLDLPTQKQPADADD